MQADTSVLDLGTSTRLIRRERSSAPPLAVVASENGPCPRPRKTPSKAPHPTYRVAVSGDEAGILKVFAEVAPEVPTAVRPQTEPLLKGLVASGQSWVAVDADDNIIGYALAEPHDSKTLSLVYLGVSKVARNQHVCSSLISKLKETGAPIITDVRSNNKSSMVERFEHLGFVKGDVNADRTKLRWEKPKEIPAA